MNYTTNYQLSQWDAEDRVTRAAFNADNAAVDAALKANADAIAAAASPLVKLRNVTLSAPQSLVNFDLSSLDTSQYAAFKLYAWANAGVAVGINGITGSNYVSPTGNTSQYLVGCTASAGSSIAAEITIVTPCNAGMHKLLSAYISAAHPSGSVLQAGSYVDYAKTGTSSTLSLYSVELRTLTMNGVGDASFGAGSRFALYGLKL